MEKTNKKKIVIGIGFVVLIGIMVTIIVLLNMPDKEYKDIYLDEMKFTKTLENLSSIYVDNEVTSVDENNRKINISSILSNEKFILDNKVGMYDFSIVSDFEDSILTFTVKNKTKEIK